MSQDEQSPDLDLIQMVQRARMLHDKSARPSDYTSVYWIEAKQQVGRHVRRRRLTLANGA